MFSVQSGEFNISYESIFIFLQQLCLTFRALLFTKQENIIRILPLTHATLTLEFAILEHEHRRTDKQRDTEIEKHT